MSREKPHLVHAAIRELDGTTTHCTVRLDELKDQPHPIHETLADDLRQKATTVYWRAGKVATRQTLDWFLDQLRYDQNPAQEIAIWECIANAFDRVGGRTLSPAQQQKTAAALMLISIGTVDVESQTCLSERRVDRLKIAYELSSGN